MPYNYRRSKYVAPIGSRPTPSYTEEVVERIRFLWADGGHTATEIARELGMTKNQIIGITQRMRAAEGEDRWPRKVRGQGTVKQRDALRASQRARREPEARKGYPVPWKAKPLPAVLPAPPTAMSVSFVERGLTQCSYPTGDDKPGPEMVCCGAPVVDNSSWCGYHQPLVFPPRGRQSQASDKH